MTMPILDFGRRTLGYHGAKRSVTGVAPSYELQEGSVEILYDMRRRPGHSEPLEAHLLKAKSSIILRSSIMSTRKIQMPIDSERISGAWIIQKSKLCGVAFSSCDNSPYLHMLPAEPLFANFAKFLGASAPTVATGKDFSDIMIKHILRVLEVKEKKSKGGRFKMFDDIQPQTAQKQPGARLFDRPRTSSNAKLAPSTIPVAH